MVRRNKTFVRRFRTTIQRNESVIGESIEIMLERIREGEEGEDGIQDRDLVYNDNEASIVNPITNIRSDKFELMLDEKIGEQEHKRRKMKVVDKDEEVEKDDVGTVEKAE